LSFRKLFAAVVATTTLSLMGAGSVSAQPQQNGLVNVNISDNVVQVPIGIAANICDVNVAVLVDDFLDQAAPCRADATGQAFVTSPDGGGEPGPGDQTGLVNLNISGNQVQIPLAVALNVCDVNVAVLVDLFDDDAATCEARARGRARSSS
jgi:hypothetical protein